MSASASRAPGSATKNKALLTEGPVGPTLLKLALPMLMGIAAIIFFQLVDTFFIGMLGDDELAAAAFSYPVTFIVLSVAFGLGMGTTSVVAQAIGRGDGEQAARLTTHALLLGILCVVFVALVGLFTIDPLFTAIGAEPKHLGLIREYMTPWYLGIGTLVVPLLANSGMRAAGDAKTPGLIMLASGGLNAVLDPILIFGLGPVPAMGLRGAAIATVIAWATIIPVALFFLRKKGLLRAGIDRFGTILASFRSILHIGLPAVASSLLVPLSDTLLTAVVATYGSNAVAGYGVGTRLASLAMVGFMALSTATAAFSAQNYGARLCDRLRQAIRFNLRACAVYGLTSGLILFALATPIATVFSDSQPVRDVTVLYQQVVPISFAPLGFSLIANSMLNGTDRPRQGLLLVSLRLFALTLPLAYLGSLIAGLVGLFLGVTLANLAVGATAYIIVSRRLSQMAAPTTDPPSEAPPLTPPTTNAPA